MPPKPKVRLKDIAERAEISVAAVSMALADHADISVETKQRVRQISRELGYRRRRSTTKTKTNSDPRSAGRFGFLLVGGRVEDEVCASMLRELTLLASSTGTRVEVSGIEDIADPENVAETALAYARGLDGLLLMGHVKMSLLQEIAAADIPYVVIGHTMLGPEETPPGRAQIVTTNAVTMGELATSRLFEAGHERIGFVCEVLLQGLMHARWLTGYAAAHLHNNAAIEPSFIFESGQTNCDGSAAAAYFAGLSQKPTAYVVPDARIAAMFSQAMRNEGLPITPDSLVLGGQEFVVQRYGLGDYPVVLDNLAQLADVGLRQLGELYNDALLTCAEVHVPFGWRNLPGGTPDSTPPFRDRNQRTPAASSND